MRILKNTFYAFVAMPFLLLSGVSSAQTEPTSFAIDVKQSIAALAVNSSAQTKAQAINGEDYRSTWDEFGMNVLIDGAVSPNEVDRAITKDIIQAVQNEKNYDQQEVQYLTASQTTPEEIQNIEGHNDSDVPPGEFIDPNPSAEANPEASMSASEDQGQNNVEENTSTENASALQAISTTEVGTSTENTFTLQATSTAETATSASEASASSKETIFDAILQGERVNPSIESTPPPPEPSPAE